MNVQQTVPLLLVRDIEKSRDFYCGGLGFKSENEWAPEASLAWCWLGHGSAALMLQQQCEGDPPPATWGKGMTLYFICDDAAAAFQEFCERGVDASEPAEAFYGMVQTFVTDSDGYKLCFENPVGFGK